MSTAATPSAVKDWPHAPVHRLSVSGTYMVTAGTLNREHFFHTPDRLGLLQSRLLALANRYGWQLEAWAVFDNHYHFIAHSPADPTTLKIFLSHLHADTASALNTLDQTPERKVWFNYWDSRLTYDKSYLARLNYVHQNAVKHGLALVANQYRWCSSAWFERTATAAQVRTLYSFKTDRLNVFDPF